MNLITEQMAQVEAVLKSGRLSLYSASPKGHLGDGKVRELEGLFCDYFKVKYAIAVNSATSGLHIACLALNVKQAIVPVVTFSATASSVIMAQGRPVFADIERSTYNISKGTLPNPLPHGTDCIIPVHLHGCPADVESLKRPDVHIIEDCAQAIGAERHGRKVGTFGDCGVFSFNQNKQIISGEGGMVITDNDDLADRLRLLRNHGETQSDILGYNFRMVELQAAVLIPQFKHLNEILWPRIELASTLSEELKDVEELAVPEVPYDCRHTFCTYPIRCISVNRNAMQKELRDAGVYFGEGGYKPLHKIPFYAKYSGEFPCAEARYRDVMYTNILRPPMRISEVKEIAHKVKESVWRINRLKSMSLP